jgi:hypothetical protein
LKTKGLIGWGPTIYKAARFGAQHANEQPLALQFSYNLLIYMVALSLYFTAKPFRLLNKQLTLNQRVPGSSPGAPTKQIKRLARKPSLLLFLSSVGATCWATRILLLADRRLPEAPSPRF